MNRKLTLFIILGLALLLIPIIANAAIVDSGECGTGVSWTLDEEGLLTISGSGYMTSTPWSKSKVKNAGINEGINNILDNAFKSCTNLIDVSIPQR